MAAGDFRDVVVWKLDRHGASPSVPSATHVTSVTHVTAGQLHSAPTLPTPWARGYRSKTKMITIIYLIAGKLPNPSPYVAHPI